MEHSHAALFLDKSLLISLCCCLITLLVVAVLITVIMATMARGTINDGLGTDLVLPAGLGPITAGLLVGPQEAVTGETLPLRAPGPPQVRIMLLQSNTGMILYRMRTENVGRERK